MTKTAGSSKSRIYFNASVVLSGFRSPRGGSGKLLLWAKNKKVRAIISETVIDEVFRHLEKIDFSKKAAARFLSLNFEIKPPPPEKDVKKCTSLVIDPGDAHVLAAAKLAKADYLVSLDKKHILAIKAKFNAAAIVDPKELIIKLSPPKLLKSRK